jgi:predicted TIM-barrel fold metal-dependent hydrolase
VSDVEARSRLASICDVLEHERHALEQLDDDRLDRALEAMKELGAAIVITLALEPPPPNGC